MLVALADGYRLFVEDVGTGFPLVEEQDAYLGAVGDFLRRKTFTK